jgi:glycerol-3-phosphate dehydrogenase
MREDEPLDVLVIGGGVVGAGSALDAVTRGLRVGLVEAQDWASGTSSRSSKLIHGGLRYLEMMDFRLVREALHERGLLTYRLAPHLVHPVPFLYPLTHKVWERIYVGTGIAIYDVMASNARSVPRLPRHRHLSRREALREAPSLRPDYITGAIAYFDAQVDDARHTVTVVRTAANFGALVASRTRVVGLERVGDRVSGARVVDLESGEDFVIHARHVISATGVWTDAIYELAGEPPRTHVRASKGIHLLVARKRLDLPMGLILRTEKSVLFVIPWGTHWIIGTTDTDWAGDRAHPVATEEDIQYLLEHLNAVLREPLRRDEIEGVYAGLRPLIDGTAGTTSKLSREHMVDGSLPGLTVIAGGKYTTYRIMARDVVDEAARHLGRVVPTSCTESVPLAGADGWSAIWRSRSELAERHGLDVTAVEHLLGRYGTLVSEVLSLIDGDPTMGERLVPEHEYLRAEVVYAVTHEGALHVEDVLQRRTHLSIETSDQAMSAAEVAVTLMAPILDWDDVMIKGELTSYLRSCQQESH